MRRERNPWAGDFNLHTSCGENINYKKLECYFLNLIKRIKKESEEKGENIVLILITRKGYWLFKHMARSEKIQKLLDGVPVKYYSDRYVLKDFDFEIVRDKKVYIFDDTICHGNNMFFFFYAFKKHGAKEVRPLAYIASTAFFNNNQLEERKQAYLRLHRDEWILDSDVTRAVEILSEEFEKCLEYEFFLAPDDVSRFSMLEMVCFQKDIEPMVMDLPVFRYMDEEQKKEIVLSEKQFETLKMPSARWEFVENVYQELDCPIQCDFFQLKNSDLYERYGNLFFNFIVKCKYQRCENGVRVIFIPFAIIKSADFLSTWNCFKSLLQKSSYYDKIEKYLYKKLAKEQNDDLTDEDIVTAMRQNHNMCRGIFRALIMSLSNYIAKLFQEKVTRDIGMTFYFDEKYMFENNYPELVDTVFDEYKNLKPDSYMLKLSSCDLENNDIQNRFDSREDKVQATEDRIESYVRNRIVRSKGAKGHKRNRIVTIEDLQKEVEMKFYFETKGQERLYLTKALILLLELSCSGNEIMVDNDRNIIYRGFKAGENSTVAVMYDMFWVYPYVYTWFLYGGKNFFYEYFESFSCFLYDYFREREYIDNLIDNSAFLSYIDYFRMVGKDGIYEQIMNKRYLLDNYYSGNEANYISAFVKDAFDKTYEWGDRVRAKILAK